MRGLLAERALVQARADLQAAQQALTQQDVTQAQRQIDAAGERTQEARSRTGDVVWRAAAQLPWAGRSLRTARGLAVAADDLASTVLPPLVTVARDIDPARLKRADGTVDLALVERSSPLLRQSSTRTTAVLRRLRTTPASLLPSPLARARRQLVKQTSDLDSALRGAAEAAGVAPALLGADRPRRYLVLVQQTGESRGTGGLIGGYALVEADAGRVRVTEQGTRGLTLDGPVAPPLGTPADYINRYGEDGAFFYGVNVNLSPDLPRVATVVAARWRAAGGPVLDGVATVDARALALLLRGNGPVDVGEGRTVAPEQLEQFLAVDQYVGVPLTSQAAAQRKERLSRVAAYAVGKLQQSGDSEALLRGLSAAVRSGHLHLTSQDPALQPVLARTGLDGALPRGSAPLAYAVVTNATGGKLDTFFTRSVRYLAEGCNGARRRSLIEVTLRSDPPPDLPPYLTIDLNVASHQSRTNRLNVAVYGTRGATLRLATLDRRVQSTAPGPSGPELREDTEAGLPVWSRRIELPPGQQRVLRLELDEPTSAGAARVPEQPLARDLSRVVRVPTCGDPSA
ncbi:MAG: hypothetical protein JWM64_2664 [Frankiales bacterium]|nr:hypothetical protein [Frankiales bacterium]